MNDARICGARGNIQSTNFLFRKKRTKTWQMHKRRAKSYGPVFDFSLGFLSSFFLSPLATFPSTEKKEGQSLSNHRFTYLLSLRPYSRYPGYTTGRFGRFRSPRQPPQAMTTRSKNLGRVAGPRPLRSVPPGRESAPKTESPGSLVPNSSVYVPEKNRSLRKWRTADHCL